MKKATVMILAAILVFCLSACSQDVPALFNNPADQSQIAAEQSQSAILQTIPQTTPAAPVITETEATEPTQPAAPEVTVPSTAEPTQPMIPATTAPTPAVTEPVHTHSYTEKVVKEVSCEENGMRRFSCTGCDHTYEESISKLGHKYSVKVTAPTCTEQGYTTHTCNFCGDNYKDSYTKAAGHTLTTVITKKATCSTAGEKTTSCSKCAYKTTEATSKLSHSYTAKITAPTCSAQGYTTHTCTHCGSSYKDTYVSALAHSLTSKETKKATCNFKGEKTVSCSKCSYTATEAIPALGHNYVATEVVAPSCAEQGYTRYVCANCTSAYRGNYTAKTAHQTKSTVSRKATCTAAGQRTTYCTKCNYTATESIPATGHDYLNVVKRPTCSAQGYTTHTCNLCDYTYIDNYTDATSHTLTTVITKKATCSTAGEKTVSCSKCSYKATESIPKAAHTLTTTVTKKATCSTAGEQVVSCSKCSYKVTQVIAKGDHVTIQATKNPTCTQDGSVTTTCYFCSYKDVKVLPATGHSFVSSVSGGKVKFTCSHCKNYATFSQGDVHALPIHTYWENGQLVAQCMVANTKSHTVTNIQVRDLTIYNTAGQQVGCGNFGVLKGLTLKSNTCTLWTFRFSSNIVSNYGSNLNGTLKHSAIVSSTPA